MKRGDFNPLYTTYLLAGCIAWCVIIAGCAKEEEVRARMDGYHNGKCSDPHCRICFPERFQDPEPEPEYAKHKFAQGDRVEHFLLGPALVARLCDISVRPGFCTYCIQYKDNNGAIGEHCCKEHELTLVQSINEVYPEPKSEAEELEARIEERVLKRLEGEGHASP